MKILAAILLVLVGGLVIILILKSLVDEIFDDQTSLDKEMEAFDRYIKSLEKK